MLTLLAALTPKTLNMAGHIGQRATHSEQDGEKLRSSFAQPTASKSYFTISKMKVKAEIKKRMKMKRRKLRILRLRACSA